MDHVYHWKHGWIPLDHIAALSKAKGNHKAAAQMLHDVANGKHGPMTPHEVARAALAVHDMPAEHRPAALNRLNDHADAHGIPVPAAARRNGSNRERLRNDVRTAQHAQQGRAEAQALGYKKETAAFYGSDKHAQAEHTERRLTTTQADHEARAQAANDREEARAHAERKKAGAIADDLTALDGMHHPDDTGALDAKAAARVARMKLTPEEADRTLQAAFNLPESPDQQALIGALVNHIEASKAATVLTPREDGKRTLSGVDQYGHPTTFTGHAEGGPATHKGVAGVAYSVHNGSKTGGGGDATARGTVFVAGDVTPAQHYAQNKGDLKVGDDVIPARGMRGTVTGFENNGRAIIHVPGKGNMTRAASDINKAKPLKARASGIPDFSKTPIARLKSALAGPGFDEAHKTAMRAELARRLTKATR